MPTRRAVLAGAAAVVGGGLLGLPRGRATGEAAGRALAPLPVPAGGREVALTLAAAPRALTLPAFAGRALPLWSFEAASRFPLVVRMRIGDTLVAKVENGIPVGQEEMSVHWHGIRLPNAEDGVPHLTQKPIPFGESYEYRFTPPDTGTYWFHTHCNTVESLGRGLLGVLVVEGDETRPYDGDLVLCLKDWRIGDDGFLDFSTVEGASRAGTFGPLRTVNGAVAPEIALPAGGDVRLRLINVDSTRIPQLGFDGAEAAVVAIDGIAVTPFPLKAWRLGPAMRLDVVVRAPADGGRARLVDYFAKEPVTLATLVGAGPALDRGDFDPAPLYAAPIPVPDLANAETLAFTFSATATGTSVASFAEAADGAPFLGPLCVASHSFWAINKAVWPGGSHASVPPPLALLRRGATYRFTLANVTPHVHPIHMHGHTFSVLSSTTREIVPHHADTVLLTPKERLEVAFVADNPGDWMLHCHIIEHQETGMMGYLRVA